LRIATPAAALMLGMLALLSGATADARSAPARARRPVVVELFTAQGCAGCPQANQRLGEIAERKDVIALAFSVDYWDYLGWKDTLAKPEFTQRQRAYAGRLKLKEIYTPELVVDGRREAAAVDADKVDALIEAEAKAAARRRAPSISFTRAGARVSVGRGAVPPGGAEVWLVRYDPAKRSVRVRSGDNAGKTVVVGDAVRELIRLGPWTGRPRTYKTPAASAPNLESVAILQGRDGGPILAAARE
jgi:hypothetical protein